MGTSKRYSSGGKEVLPGISKRGALSAQSFGAWRSFRSDPRGKG